MNAGSEKPDGARLVAAIRDWGVELGFQQLGVASVNLETAEKRLADWLAQGFHGDMGWMARHGTRRSRPQELRPGTVSVICARMDYLPESADKAIGLLDHRHKAYISRYALGRDYHKVLRGRLRKLARRVEAEIGPFGHRVFVDSAPVLEKPLAEQAGLGWIGKHTNLINHRAGSWFFLGEIYTDLVLPADAAASGHCGSCRACIDVCPTQAIVAPYQLDARRCISYLTIEQKGPIPEALRPAIGNRIYGCDDCQLFCPWNKYAAQSKEVDFKPRHGLADADLVDLMNWDEATWLARTEGSAMRRIGYRGWLRNIAVALGNAEPNANAIAALRLHADHADPVIREHVHWALERQTQADT